METSELSIVKPKTPVLGDERGLKLRSLDEIWRFAIAVVNSGLYKDINTPEIAVVRLQAGLELGLTPIWALANIAVLNGRPMVWGDALLGLVLNHRDCEDVIETFEGEGDQLTAICEVHRRGRHPIIRKFRVSDAKRAGLHGRNVHNSYPSRMLQMRARSWACRDAFADALRGLSVIEEVRDIEPRAVVEREKPAIVLPDEVDLSGGGKSPTETRSQSTERELLGAGGVSDEATSADRALSAQNLTRTRRGAAFMTESDLTH